MKGNTTSRADTDVQQSELTHIAGENSNLSAALGNNSAVLQNTTLIPTIFILVNPLDVLYK